MLEKDRRGLRYWTWRSARVSKSLLSLVTLGAPNVGEKRRAAVLRAAAELGYRRNELARGPVRGRTHTIGVLLSDPHNPFFAETVAGMEESDSFRYRTLLGTGYRGPQREVRAIRHLLERQAEGIALLSPRIPNSDIHDVASNVPTVLVGCRTREASVDSVVNGDFAGAVLVVEHLYELGHRRIAHISGGSGAGPGRDAGITSALCSASGSSATSLSRPEHTQTRAATRKCADWSTKNETNHHLRRQRSRRDGRRLRNP
jgi:DNA-binding LacI/PurR family transcriptional regulator